MTGVSSPALRDVVILAAAVVGIGGSYLLYRKRRSDAAERLRSALYAEVATTGEQMADEARQMEAGDVTESPYVPTESPFVPTVYRNSADEFGRLTAEEVQALTVFYAAGELFDERLRRKREEPDLSPVEAMYLRAKLEELLDLNEAALEALEAEMDEPSTLDSQRIFGELAVLPLDDIRDGLSVDESDRS